MKMSDLPVVVIIDAICIRVVKLLTVFGFCFWRLEAGSHGHGNVTLLLNWLSLASSISYIRVLLLGLTPPRITASSNRLLSFSLTGSAYVTRIDSSCTPPPIGNGPWGSGLTGEVVGDTPVAGVASCPDLRGRERRMSLALR